MPGNMHVRKVCVASTSPNVKLRSLSKREQRNKVKQREWNVFNTGTQNI